MDQAELLRYLLDTLDRQGLEYAITGSHASMAFGEARLTNDIDVLVALTPGYGSARPAGGAAADAGGAVRTNTRCGNAGG